MTKTEIVEVFEGIADIMQIKGEEPRRFQMYRRIAGILDSLQEDIGLMYEQGKLMELPGIGHSTVKKIGELIGTGQCEYYEELKVSIPAGVMDLMSISGVGPATAARLYQELGIDSLESLQEALDTQKLRQLKRMGKKTEEKLKAGLEALLRHRQHKLMGHLLPPVQKLVTTLAKLQDVGEVSLAGGLRRRTETVKDAQIIAVCKSPAKMRDALMGMEWIEAVNDDWTGSGGTARLMGNAGIHVRLVSQEEFGPTLAYITGSEKHIAELNNLASQLHLEPLAETSPAWARGLSENEIYAALGLPFIIPELRERRGEIQAAPAGRLPHLIETGDIRGDLHVHTSWSDGANTVEMMAKAAQEIGYEYICICDHSVSSKIANGLSVERILNQMIEVREVNERIPDIEILMGSEVDILKDGSLDYPDNILEKLDVVIASVHSGFNMDEAVMTKRITAAIENRFVNIIGHPTGRILSRRDPYQVNIDALIDAAADSNTFLEINAYPDRLDLKDVHVHRAKERGVMLSINTDAHSASDLALMTYGIYMARRGWLERKDVLNALPLPELMEVISNDN